MAVRDYFIVTGWNESGAMLMMREKEYKGILFHSSIDGTLFKSRQEARNAIRRTKAYAARNHFEWSLFNSRIQKVSVDAGMP